jgi:site-specific DNA recombinase
MIETLERPKTSSMKPQTGGWNPWENIRSFWEETLVRTYCLYVRKSSEDDERQALSIESQIEAMRKVAERDKLDVVEIIRESKSAKASGAREGFNTLLDWLRQWRYNSILSWAPDRLSRNAWDLGSVVDLMDQGKLQEIRTNGQIFKNAPNEKFLLMILCSQAKLENDNRSINVIRGLKTKAELGHLPHKAPLGYTNERSYLRNGWKIAIDPERAPYIKLIFEKVAHEGMSGRAVQRFLLEETPMRTRSGKPLVVSAIYSILNNSMYYGMYEYPRGSGNWCKGNYEPIITKELFDEVQDQLNLSPRYRPRNKNFEFTKIMKCGMCGSGITAQEKFKKILGQKDPRSYVYYHCSKCHDHKCKNPMIREDALILQLLEMLDDIDINTISVWDSLKEEIRRYNLFQSQLLKKDSRDVVSAKQINLREYMKYMISNGSKDEKREILGMIQADIILKDKKVYIEKSGSFKVS